MVVRAAGLTCLLGAVWSAFGAWASAASANWLPAEPVSRSIGIRECPVDRTRGPFLARDAAGDAVVAWVRAGRGPIGENFVIEAAARSAGGVWRPPSVIASGMVRVPVVAMTSSGEALIVWPSTRYPRRNGYSKARESVNVRTLATHGSSAWSAKHVLAAHVDPGGLSGGGSADCRERWWRSRYRVPHRGSRRPGPVASRRSDAVPSSGARSMEAAEGDRHAEQRRI